MKSHESGRSAGTAVHYPAGAATHLQRDRSPLSEKGRCCTSESRGICDLVRAIVPVSDRRDREKITAFTSLGWEVLRFSINSEFVVVMCICGSFEKPATVKRMSIVCLGESLDVVMQRGTRVSE